METDRIKYHESLGLTADDHLETVYFQIYHQTSSADDKRAFGTILDEYTKDMLQQPFFFGNAAFDYRDALLWVGKFPGKFSCWEASPGELMAHPELRKDRCKYGARIDRGDPRMPAVYGKTYHDTILLAGVQVLREIAYGVLNPSFAGACKH